MSAGRLAEGVLWLRGLGWSSYFWWRGVITTLQGNTVKLRRVETPESSPSVVPPQAPYI